MAVTATGGVTTYSVDGRKLFSSGGGYFPRERMSINFSTWFIDLPFKGAPRTWDMRVDWLYYRSGTAVSVKAAQKAAARFAAEGTSHVDTLPEH